MIIVLSLLVVFLSGCAGRLVGKPPFIENYNFAIVHIARPSGYSGCGMRMTIQLDQTDFYWLACGEHIVFRVPANKLITISQTTSMSPDDIDIEPEKGKHYYFENDCNGWACWLQETSKGKFMRLIKGIKEVKNVGY
jgi:hypothetical protein